MSMRFLWVSLATALWLCVSPPARAQDPPESRVFVLVIGIEDYADPKIPDLDYAEDDAQAVYDFFARSPRSPTVASRVKLLRGKQATRIGVLQEIRDHLIRRATRSGDTAILYFAGHGFSDAHGVYLATSDTQMNALQFSSITKGDLLREWGKISAGRRVLLVDACHSAGLKGNRGFLKIGKEVVVAKSARGSASVVITASSGNQLSVEDKRSKHGVFTASLLDALAGVADKNRDGTTSLGELANHLKTQVPRLAKEAGGNQTPMIHFLGSEALGRRLVLSSGKARPKAAVGGSHLARLESERRAAEKEKEAADLRAKLAEARLEKLKGASAEERHTAQAEVARLKTEAAKALQAVERLRAEESKRIAAEKRAAKAEAEAAELRRELAELKGQKAEAARAKREAEVARARERELASKSKPVKPGAGKLDLVVLKSGEELRGRITKETPGSVVVHFLSGGVRGKMEVPRDRIARIERRLRSGKSAPTGYAKDVERAKRLKGFSYLETKTFSCGGKTFSIARFKHSKTGLVFHLVPGGSYMLGSSRGEDNEKPVTKVTIQPFLICATECTQAAWNRVMRKNPSQRKGAQLPIELVSWDFTQVFVQAAGLRLPSEAEWEYACRAGSTSAYCFGDSEDDLKRYAVYGNKPQGTRNTRDVGTKLTNAFGLHDVHGNAWEWCQDDYASRHQGARPDGSKRVCRGGGWFNEARGCRSAVRFGLDARSRDPNIGFRPARSLP